MKKLLFFWLLLTSLTSYGQYPNTSTMRNSLRGQEFSFEYWHKGYAVLEGGDTLRGQIKYNMQTDLVQVQEPSNRIETLTARKVVFVEIFDALQNEYRHFYSLPFANQGGYKAPVFFELLTEGKMTLLAREALEYKTYSSFYYYGSYTRLVLVYKWFLLDDKGELKEFQGKKNDWLYAMGNYGEQVQKYVKANKLDFDDKKDLTKIVEYYNSFYKKD